MENVYKQKFAKIISVEKENDTVSTLVLRLPDQKRFQFRAGQFMMIGLPGFGECPISFSSDPHASKKQFALTIRAVGELTTKLIGLKKGDSVLVRGPFGNGFPEVAGNLVLIAGGCGVAPVMSVFVENKNRKDVNIKFFIGCRNQESLLFSGRMPEMKKHSELTIALDQKKLLKLGFKSGSVAEAVGKADLPADAKVFICGPIAMYPAIAKILIDKKIDPKNIFMSLENRMHCGVGVCEHCAIGTRYVCKDGPVFSYDFLQQFDKYSIDL
jgi:NAD(P)H-flavin reductase